MGHYSKLIVWRRAHRLALRIYHVTDEWPAKERYGLTAQIRRAAASIPTNLAEGCGRNTFPELARFGRIALGSANEVEYQVLFARDLGYLTDPIAQELMSEIRRICELLSRLTKTCYTTRSNG